MKKKALLGLVTVAGLTLTLAACGGNSSKGTSSSSDSATADTGDFKLKTTNTKEAIKDGTLEIGSP